MEMFLILSGALGQIWLLSGILLNLLQAIAWLTIRPISPRLYRRINYYLVYANWSQIVVLGEWFSGSRARLYFPDKISEEMFNQELTICVSNHKYELDWLWCWFASDKFGILGNSKGVAKKSLKMMPVMGWCWYFSEFIFLARDWEKDSQILGECLDRFIQYACPLLILLFCEGTRFTREKYEASLEFAQKRGLPLYKHHLVPRGRGFVYSIQHLTQKKALAAIYNVQIAFHEEHNKGKTFNFATILKGQSLVGDVYIERIPIEKIDTTSAETINKFLLDLYSKKDELMDYHNANAKFPGHCRIFKRRLAPLLNWMFWFTLISGALVWVMSQGTAYLSTVAAILTTGVIAFWYMIRSTKAKGGSSYGTTPKSTPKREPKINGATETISAEAAEDAANSNETLKLHT